MTVITVDFDPDKKRIEDIFAGSLQLVIPRYQRTYSWPKEKAEEFYADFIEESEKAEDNLAFLGTILFAISEDKSLEVIDGQQRLVTITLFLAALRDVLAKSIRTTEAYLAAEHIQNMIKISSTFGSSYSNSEASLYKLRVGIEIEHIFNEMVYIQCDDIRRIKPLNSAEKKVLDAYQYFHKRLKETLERPGLQSAQKIQMADRILSRINAIEYIDIRVTNKEVAYNLFESHNAKGVALAKTDLIKNFYFGRLSGSDSEKNKKMDEWDTLLENLVENTTNMLSDRFFYYMLQSYDGNFPSGSLYRKIKPSMNDHQKFFNKLKKNVNLMIELKNGNTNDPELNRILHSLSDKLKVNQCFILLLALHRNRDMLSPAIYKKIFRLIEEFTYIYSGITKSPGNALEKVYSKHAKQLEDTLREFNKNITVIDKEKISGKLLSELKKDLQELTPNFGIFFEAFSNLRYTNRTNKIVIRYTFEKIELHHSNGLVVLGESFTLDHIIAQKKAKGDQYHSIGNLTPMSAKTNSAKGSTEATQENYLDISNFYSVKKLQEQLPFTEESISERTEYLAKYAYYEAFADILKS
ncbi:DUF262 domain-containing protein [Candidatus Saccharibacteria bacterium]|nr:DUF262 domain-containing protein [Candidatus Saccharibacteria bacterium]